MKTLLFILGTFLIIGYSVSLIRGDLSYYYNEDQHRYIDVTNQAYTLLHSPPPLYVTLVNEDGRFNFTNCKFGPPVATLDGPLSCDIQKEATQHPFSSIDVLYNPNTTFTSYGMHDLNRTVPGYFVEQNITSVNVSIANTILIEGDSLLPSDGIPTINNGMNITVTFQNGQVDILSCKVVKTFTLWDCTTNYPNLLHGGFLLTYKFKYPDQIKTTTFYVVGSQDGIDTKYGGGLTYYFNETQSRYLFIDQNTLNSSPPPVYSSLFNEDGRFNFSNCKFGPSQGNINGDLQCYIQREATQQSNSIVNILFDESTIFTTGSKARNRILPGTFVQQIIKSVKYSKDNYHILIEGDSLLPSDGIPTINNGMSIKATFQNGQVDVLSCKVVKTFTLWDCTSNHQNLLHIGFNISYTFKYPNTIKVSHYTVDKTPDHPSSSSSLNSSFFILLLSLLILIFFTK